METPTDITAHKREALVMVFACVVMLVGGFAYLIAASL